MVVEILSPSTATRDQTEKKAVYEENGVDEYWIVDPRRRTMTVCTRGDTHYDAGRVFERDRRRSRVLPKLRVQVEKRFAT